MQQVPIILLGVGGVGSSLLRQILQHRKFHVNEYNLDLQIMAVCDSNGAVFNSRSNASHSNASKATRVDNALDDSLLQSIVELKGQNGRLCDHPSGQEFAGEAAILDWFGDQSGHFG